jgi:hypothetical protein
LNNLIEKYRSSSHAILGKRHSAEL